MLYACSLVDCVASACQACIHNFLGVWPASTQGTIDADSSQHGLLKQTAATLQTAGIQNGADLHTIPIWDEVGRGRRGHALAMQLQCAQARVALAQGKEHHSNHHALTCTCK